MMKHCVLLISNKLLVGILFIISSPLILYYLCFLFFWSPTKQHTIQKSGLEMQLPNQEEEMPLPLNSFYGMGHPSSHNKLIIIPSSSSAAIATQIPSNGGYPLPSNLEDYHYHHNVPYKNIVRYRECLKNHAAAIGGNATDGCGEFMPNGEEGYLQGLTCSACNCHRNFHRKEMGNKVILGHHLKTILGPESSGYPTRVILPLRIAPPPPHPMMMSYNLGPIPSETDEQEECGGDGGIMGRPAQVVKKRFRTKFSQEQKEKMFSFAEKVGWKLQRQEEDVVQKFCQEVGVRRRALKVWMHNNKHNMDKKINSNVTFNQV